MVEAVKAVADPKAPKAEPSDRKVGDLLRAWLAHVENRRLDLAASTKAAYRRTVKMLHDEDFDVWHIQIDRLQDHHLEDLQRDVLVRRGVHAANGHCDRVLMAWNWGRARGLVPDRPLRLRRLKAEKKAKPIPTPEELELVRRQLPLDERGRMVRLGMMTGARVGELAALTLDDLDFERRRIRLSGKTGPRWFPLDDEACRELSSWPWTEGETAWGRTFHSIRNAATAVLRDACEAAGVGPYTFHALRRAFIADARQAGIDLETLASIMGHSVQVMLKYYRQPTDGDKVAAVERIAMARRSRPGEVYSIDRD